MLTSLHLFSPHEEYLKAKNLTKRIDGIVIKTKGTEINGFKMDQKLEKMVTQSEHLITAVL